MKRNSQEEKKKKTEDAGLKKVYTREERIYPKRVAALLLFVAATIFFMTVNAYRGMLATGGFICEALLIVPACLVTVLLMIHQRKEKRLWYQDTDYLAFVLIYTIANAILTVAGFFLPDFLLPVAVCTFLIASCGNETLTIASSLLMTVSVSFGSRYDGSVYGLFFSEVIIAVGLAELIIKALKKDRAVLFLVVTAVQCVLPLSVRYFTKLAISKNDLYFSLGLSIITGVVSVTVYPALYRRLHLERSYRYETILDDDYSLINEIKLFSDDEYERARKLSVVSLKAAREIGADAALAAAGGLYYRVGLLRGDQEIEHAVQIAGEHGFPDQLISILYEYQGLIRKPTSKESAIVHMTDAVMRRLDAISKQSDKMESGWNRQMLIYSALNELSTGGFYDDSSITMNQFLKIRDVLAKEL
ncbi:MAG: hypothetical protein PUF16_04705 [Lachnospiraceae bacterium]|nr:hypothetical protein [Lachnospiraceae bacterium]